MDMGHNPRARVLPSLIGFRRARPSKGMSAAFCGGIRRLRAVRGRLSPMVDLSSSDFS